MVVEKDWGSAVRSIPSILFWKVKLPYVTYSRILIGKRAIKFKCSKLWNNLPTDIKEIQSCSAFKYNLKD